MDDFISLRNLFILAGNGPYDNRGCEAIVRGTTEIIRLNFDKPKFISVSNFWNNDQLKEQIQDESDRSIKHYRSFPVLKRFSSYWFLHTILRFSFPKLRRKLIYRSMLTVLKDARAVLSIGGDNYSFDNGKPVLFTMLDDLVLAYKKPLIIWGASVGPFDKNPNYERYIVQHLKKVTGIFVRESMTLEYLNSKNIKDNVFLVADPAFLLRPIEPVWVPKIDDGAIGINLSPLMSKYLTDGHHQKWVILAAQIVREIYKRTNRKIYLIPHVTSPNSNDYSFLAEVLSLLEGVDVVLIGDRYNAAEIKWIISKMTVFVGARTHSTLAALSTYVPTLSFVYSIKARGINRDIFGHEKFCIFKKDCVDSSVAERVVFLLKDRESVCGQLKARIPEFQRMALSAGKKLVEVCG